VQARCCTASRNPSSLRPGLASARARGVKLLAPGKLPRKRSAGRPASETTNCEYGDPRSEVQIARRSIPPHPEPDQRSRAEAKDTKHTGMHLFQSP
jgi:hypothetical protein